MFVNKGISTNAEPAISIAECLASINSVKETGAILKAETGFKQIWLAIWKCYNKS